MIKNSELIGTKVPAPWGWHEFKVSDLFDCISIPQIPKYVDLQKGDIPYVTQTEVNNGVKQYIKPTDDLQLNVEKGIVLGVDTQVVYYQEKPFYANKMIQLIFKQDASKLHYLFAMSLLKAQFKKYNYNNKLSLSRLKDTELELPVTSNDSPDYGWMSSYIRELENQYIHELENQRIRELETYLQVTGLSDNILSDEEKVVLEQWRQHEKFGGGTCS